jgi:hypothetical protein
LASDPNDNHIPADQTPWGTAVEIDLSNDINTDTVDQDIHVFGTKAPAIINNGIFKDGGVTEIYETSTTDANGDYAFVASNGTEMSLKISATDSSIADIWVGGVKLGTTSSAFFQRRLVNNTKYLDVIIDSDQTHLLGLWVRPSDTQGGVNTPLNWDILVDQINLSNLAIAATTTIVSNQNVGYTIDSGVLVRGNSVTYSTIAASGAIFGLGNGQAFGWLIASTFGLISNLTSTSNTSLGVSAYTNGGTWIVSSNGLLLTSVTPFSTWTRQLTTDNVGNIGHTVPLISTATTLTLSCFDSGTVTASPINAGTANFGTNVQLFLNSAGTLSTSTSTTGVGTAIGSSRVVYPYTINPYGGTGQYTSGSSAKKGEYMNTAFQAQATTDGARNPEGISTIVAGLSTNKNVRLGLNFVTVNGVNAFLTASTASFFSGFGAAINEFGDLTSNAASTITDYLIHCPDFRGFDGTHNSAWVIYRRVDGLFVAVEIYDIGSTPQVSAAGPKFSEIALGVVSLNACTGYQTIVDTNAYKLYNNYSAVSPYFVSSYVSGGSSSIGMGVSNRYSTSVYNNPVTSATITAPGAQITSFLNVDKYQIYDNTTNGASAMGYNKTVASGSIVVNLTWTARTLSASSNWIASAWGNNMFVAISNTAGTVAASSPDGITWTARTLPTSANWRSVTYGNGLFVAIAGSSNTTVAASSPDGITWTARTLPSSSTWSSITWGNGLFVAVAENTTAAASSPDGITWTARTMPSSSDWFSVTFGNGLYVAVAYASTIAATSTNGTTWTSRTLPSSANWDSVVWGNGLFVAVSGINTTVAASSPDGITWTARTMPSSASWTSIAFGNGLFFAIAAGTSPAATSAYSYDGISWTTKATAANVVYNSITFGAGTFITVASGGTAAASAPLSYTNNIAKITEQQFLSTSYTNQSIVPPAFDASFGGGGITMLSASAIQVPNFYGYTIGNLIGSFTPPALGGTQGNFFNQKALTFFRLYGQYYGFDGDNVYSITLSGGSTGTITGNPQIVAYGNGLQYLTSSPTEAIFLSSYDNSIFSFNGGRVISKIHGFNKEATIIAGAYNVRDNALYLLTASSVITVRDTMITSNSLPAGITASSTTLNSTDQGIYFTTNNVYVTRTYYFTTTSAQPPIALDWQSAYYGPGNGEAMLLQRVVAHVQTSRGLRADLSFTWYYKTQDAAGNATAGTVTAWPAGTAQTGQLCIQYAGESGSGYGYVDWVPTNKYVVGGSLRIQDSTSSPVQKLVLLDLVVYYKVDGPAPIVGKVQGG